ncbi:MAG: demethylmenaquinone methyltransferase / 2-methoxy-6-polyprenyl,4-benzoquinol methylase [Abditibacteriota bacterium]|nr:demethylmenaquinone methyltransferase / 2-methoxy-6-polyprenyl,4-benzoquinol methylase [Abditibacteriota bacterium]
MQSVKCEVCGPAVSNVEKSYAEVSPPVSAETAGDEWSVDKSSGAVRAMFGDIAGRYDYLNHLLSANQDRRWRRRAIRLLSPRANDYVLDLCCGTGDLAFECLQQQPACRVVGADFAVPMLSLAQQKRHNRDQSTFIAGDALRLPFASATFDKVMVGFGARNFENTRAGLSEMLRVLKPGGKALVLEFMRPTFLPLRVGASAFNSILAPIGRSVSGHATAYNYLPQSIGGFYTRDGFVDLLRTVGFGNMRAFDYMAGVATAFIAHKPQ